MIDTIEFPSTIAKALVDVPFTMKDVTVTFTENIDEKQLYANINKRLIKLERSLDVHRGELPSIRKKVELFKVLMEEKEELLLRLDWLDRLYRVKDELRDIDTREKAKKLRRTLAAVQTCPLKKQLLEEIDAMEQKLPEEVKTLTVEQRIMEKAIEDIGAVFINLGKVGREYVISKAIDNHGESVTMEQIRDLSLDLEANVEKLKECRGSEELSTQLEQLPLRSFHTFDADRKEAIAARLLENKQWNGLATLDRMIIAYDRAITAEEKEALQKENTIEIADGKAALILNVENVENGIIKI